MSSFAERGYYSGIEQEDRLQISRPAVLSYKTHDFSQYNGLFIELFGSDPDSTFLTYNPSATFTNPLGEYRAVRIDSSNGQTKSVIFKRTSEGLEPYKEKTFDLQDPFAVIIDSEIVFGGVHVDNSFNDKGEIVSNFKTIFYRGKTIPEFTPFFIGPDGMKDIRPIKLPNGKIGVYTRPRSLGNERLGGDGQIGYRDFESLDAWASADSSSLNVENAPFLSNFRFTDGKWGGVNHAQVVRDGKYQGWNLLLIHTGSKSDNVRHYTAGMLLHNFKTGEIVDLGTILETSDLGPGRWKGQETGDEDLKDICFGGELIVKRDKLTVIGGRGDAECFEAELSLPPELVA